MTERTSPMRWLAIGLVAIAVASGVWLAVGSSRDRTEVRDEVMGDAPGASASGQGAVETTPTATPTPEEPIAPPADHYIDDSGRLSLSAASLPARGAVTFGLALDEKALGTGQDPLATVVVSTGDGRRLELSATPVAGLRSGVRLEVDAAWLEPGLYMIQIRTAEKTALPLRRYVLEVRAAPAPQASKEVPEDLR